LELYKAMLVRLQCLKNAFSMAAVPQQTKISPKSITYLKMSTVEKITKLKIDNYFRFYYL